jgi:deoxyhypusine synthase
MGYKEINKEQIARENILRRGEEISGLKIKGYDFEYGVDYSKIFSNLKNVGFQASNLGKAIEIVDEMISENSFIYLGFTSNQVSSGNREIIRYLVQNKKINFCVTTAGGVEEDIMKCMGDFYLGNFNASGKELREKGINRIGNIFVANNRYVEFEKFIQPIFMEMYKEQKKNGKIFSASELVWKLGERISNEDSICYWAWKNKIPLHCPAITDGALGDQIYFFKSKNSDFKVDVSDDIVEINNSTMSQKKTGVIILGAGVVKHHLLNANMFRNGADYAVFVNNAGEFDGSDAGALPEEAVSWGKLLPDSKRVKVFGDTTIILPILVGESFARK